MAAAKKLAAASRSGEPGRERNQRVGVRVGAAISWRVTAHRRENNAASARYGAASPGAISIAWRKAAAQAVSFAIYGVRVSFMALTRNVDL